MKLLAERAPGLLHNFGCASRASIVWRGIGRGPLSDDAERIEVARRRGTWLHVSISIGQRDARYHRDWNTAAALLRLIEPEHSLAESAATRRLIEAIEAHTKQLDWPSCLLVGDSAGSREQRVTLDHVPTTFVALSKSTGSLWVRGRPPRLAPLHAAHLMEPGSTPMRGVGWGQSLWFPDGIPESLLQAAMAQLPGSKRRANPVDTTVDRGTSP
jgi:hypothetical protein